MPSAVGSLSTTEWSTRSHSTAATSASGRPAAAPAASATSRGKLPLSTDSASHSTRCSAPHRAWLHSTSERRSRWRARTFVLEPARSGQRSSIRSSSSASGSERRQPAASSMARGTPSRLLQISSAKGRVASISSNPWSTARARSTNSASACCSGSGPTVSTR
ncbi:hypothetical protein ACFQGX_01930 [Nonomuraea dietziae]|uniref:hypothetical protein n=1 Tax=Nonomuraea dietziae TaxID=65515 RepID=UPI0036095393